MDAMIGLAIFVMGILGIFSLQSIAVGKIGQQQRMLMSTNEMGGQLEQLRALAYNTVTAGQNSGDVDVNGDGVMDFTLTWVVLDNTANTMPAGLVKAVDVDVSGIRDKVRLIYIQVAKFGSPQVIARFLLAKPGI
jgi:Tfp pilus assembly protein PilV